MTIRNLTNDKNDYERMLREADMKVEGGQIVPKRVNFNNRSEVNYGGDNNEYGGLFDANTDAEDHNQ